METPTGITNLLEGAATPSAPAPFRVAVRESADSVISPAGQVGSIARAGRTPRRTRRGATTGASVDQRVILVMASRSFLVRGSASCGADAAREACRGGTGSRGQAARAHPLVARHARDRRDDEAARHGVSLAARSEEHTSELPSP